MQGVGHFCSRELFSFLTCLMLVVYIRIVYQSVAHEDKFLHFCQYNKILRNHDIRIPSLLLLWTQALTSSTKWGFVKSIQNFWDNDISAKFVVIVNNFRIKSSLWNYMISTNQTSSNRTKIYSRYLLEIMDWDPSVFLQSQHFISRCWLTKKSPFPACPNILISMKTFSNGTQKMIDGNNGGYCLRISEHYCF